MQAFIDSRLKRPFARPQIAIETIFALLISAVFALFLAKGTWLGAAAVLGGAGLILLLLKGLLPLAVLWIAGMPTIFVLVNNGLGNIPFLTADRGIFLALAGLFVAHLLLQSRNAQRLGPVEKAMGAYLLVILISWASTFGDKAAQLLWKDAALLFDGFLMPFAAFMIARAIPWRDRQIMRFLWLLVAGVGGYLVIIGLAQQFLGWTFFAPTRYINIHPDRVTGSFPNALAYGIVLASLLILSLWLYLRSSGLWTRIFLAAIFVGLALCIVLSQGRAVWLAVPIGLLFLFFRAPRLRSLLVSLALVVGVMGPLILPFVTDVSRLAERLTAFSPVFNRVALTATALNMAADKPILGFGFGETTFRANKSRYYATWGNVPLQYAAEPSVPHNEFLNVLIMTGALGLFAFLVLLWVSWRMLARQRKALAEQDPLRAELAVFVQAVFLMVLFNGLFLDLSSLSYFVLVLLYFLMGIVAHEAPPDSERTSEASH